MDMGPKWTSGVLGVNVCGKQHKSGVLELVCKTT